MIRNFFLGGRISRRMFTLFLLSAVVPALALAVLTLDQVRAVLTTQTQARLSESGKNYALTMYERLLMVNDNLVHLGNDLSDEHVNADAVKPLANIFSAVSIVGPDAAPVAISGAALAWSGVNAEQLAHLANGESVMFVVPQPNAPPRLRLLHRLDTPKRSDSALLAEIEPGHLWGSPDALPYDTDVCMLTEDGLALFCSESHLYAAASRLGSMGATPQQAASIAGAEYTVGQWPLFLKPKFHVGQWLAIAIQPTATALAPVTRFSRIFIGIVVLAMLLAALLSASQIRRTLVPLNDLLQGTRRVMSDDFSHRVAVHGGDEFGELGGAFNDMAARLGRQIGALQVLSRIDRVILAKPDRELVFRAVLSRVRELTGNAEAGIAVLDPGCEGEARMYLIGPTPEAELEMARVHVGASAVAELAQHRRGRLLANSDELRLYLPNRLPAAAKQAYVLPILSSGVIRAFGYVVLERAEDLPADVVRHLRDLGDRIGVALAAVSRDEELVFQARHDDLTGLPNRLLFKERLSGEIAFAQREKRSLALLYIDLDRFKSINDTLGHSAGDRLLEDASQRLRCCLRESDTAARLGGDEFAIILPGVNGVASVSTVAEHLLGALSRSFTVAGQDCYVSASIGITLFPSDGDSGEELLQKADTAMYRAKATGGGRFVYFEARMNAEAVARVNLERELRQALLRDEFALYFQPQWLLAEDAMAGAEVLLRWNHPTRGLLPASEFIELAEDLGLIEEIGSRVLRQACTQYAAWNAAGLHPPRLAINVSGHQFRRGNLVALVEETLNASGVPGRALEVEVTESLFMDKGIDAVGTLRALRALGLKVSLDDFGTGYSSMSYLKRLPVDVLKIDRSFITDLADDADARAIAQVIISLAHTLRKGVVAEGVETKDQLALLAQWGCDIIQGHYFSEPMTATRFEEFLGSAQCPKLPLAGRPALAGLNGIPMAEREGLATVEAPRRDA